MGATFDQRPSLSRRLMRALSAAGTSLSSRPVPAADTMSPVTPPLPPATPTTVTATHMAMRTDHGRLRRLSRLRYLRQDTPADRCETGDSNDGASEDICQDIAATHCSHCVRSLFRISSLLQVLYAPVQCIVSPGGSSSVRATIRAATSSPGGLMREGRVLSRSRRSRSPRPLICRTAAATSLTRAQCPSRPSATHAVCVGVVEERGFSKAARPFGGHRTSGAAASADAEGIAPGAAGRIAERVILGIGAAISR